jgi:signal transduction histidine kinase
MRLKTFFATYALFICIFFVSLVVISVYMTNSQLTMLKEKSEAEFRTITASLSKDIAVLSGRNLNPPAFEESVQGLVEGYERYYQKNHIKLALENMANAEAENPTDREAENRTELSFTSEGQKSLLMISGTLPGSFQHYRLNYSCDISQSVSQLSRVQNILLLLAVVFAVLAAFALYFALSEIFRPLSIVSRVSRKIADGRYDERIRIKGRNELSDMAENFNRMAVQIEKQIRLLEEEASQKQRFVDNFAHEIRTPLTSIYGYAEYMQKTRCKEEEVAESVQLILNEAGYMRKISDSLLELAMMRQYAVSEREVNLPRLLNGVAQSLRGAIPDQQAEIICECEADAVVGQEDLLRSLLLNLGVNALKACPESGGVVRLEAKEEEGRVVLSVTDNGCGIPEESIPKVAEPFYRVDKARSRETGGVGLGLALCRQIASVHDAGMHIESEPGCGTRVEIVWER